MKQFIVLLAVFPLMMAFMLQFAVQQNLDYRIQTINKTVDNACEKAKTEGRFTEENIESLRNRLAGISGCMPEDVAINVPEEVRYRTGEYDEREMIEYSISVPIDGIVAMPGFFGISGDENRMVYVLENEFASERLM